MGTLNTELFGYILLSNWQFVFQLLQWLWVRGIKGGDCRPNYFGNSGMQLEKI
jgi:hypothetical protein